MNATVHKLEVGASVGIVKKRVRKSKAKKSNVAAFAIGGVAAVLVSLSLSHLAHGIHLVTQSPVWEAWAMAIGIDLGFVALELSMLACADSLRRKIASYANPAIIGTIGGSALLNALAFAYQANGVTMQVIAAAIGVAIPAMIYALTKIGALMWLDRK